MVLADLHYCTSYCNFNGCRCAIFLPFIVIAILTCCFDLSMYFSFKVLPHKSFTKLIKSDLICIALFNTMY